MVLSYQAAEAIQRKKLRVVLQEYEPPALPIQIVFPSTRLLSAKVRAFVELAARAGWRFS
jgi:DNA-binding transcriptional LysR family regulator